jgi:hypothetical protein
MPPGLAEGLLKDNHSNGYFGDTELFVGNLTSNEKLGGHSPTIYAVESLLSGKLGVSAELERRQIAFTASLAGRQEGFAIYPELGEKEHLRMLNVVVQITRGSHLVPQQTASYRAGRWVSVSDYFEMWRSRDVTKAGMSAQDALRGICVDGLCISSTYDVLASYLGGQPEVRRSAA